MTTPGTAELFPFEPPPARARPLVGRTPRAREALAWCERMIAARDAQQKALCRRRMIETLTEAR